MAQSAKEGIESSKIQNSLLWGHKLCRCSLSIFSIDYFQSGNKENSFEF